MTILVTGGAGFIGSHVVDAYLQVGHRVIVVDDLSSGRRENVNPGAEFHQIDIRGNEVSAIFERNRVDVLNHHAAQMDVRKSVADPSFDGSVNILGGLNLFEACRRHGVGKIIFASTGGAIYGEQESFPADEQHPTKPLSPYGISKLSTEKYLYYYKHVCGIEHVILRYANVYGPRQNPHGEAGVVAIFSAKMLQNQRPVINGDGLQTRDYTYVSDVVRANLLALDFPASDTFNVGTGVETDVNTVYEILRRHLQLDLRAEHGPAKGGEQRRSVISSEKLFRAFGWRPAVRIEDGLKETAEFFRRTRG
jgi:UDP-glucose 4-epimerase